MVFTKGLSLVLSLNFVHKYSQPKPKVWLTPFMNMTPVHLADKNLSYDKLVVVYNHTLVTKSTILSKSFSEQYTFQLRSIEREMFVRNWQHQVQTGLELDCSGCDQHPHLTYLVRRREELTEQVKVYSQQKAYRPTPQQVKIKCILHLKPGVIFSNNTLTVPNLDSKFFLSFY